MIRGRRKLSKDLHPPPGIYDGTEHDFLEEIGGDMLGTTESHQEPPGGQNPKGVEVEKLVASGGSGNILPLGSQGRRIDDNHIEISSAPLEIGKGIPFDQISLLSRITVEREILPDQLQR